MKERVLKGFIEAFDVDPSIDTSTLVYREYPAWTSVGHMILISALEAEFDVMLETDEIVAMSSFDKAMEIMGKHAAAA